MIDAVLNSRIMLSFATAFFAVVVSVLLFLGLRRIQRVGRPRSGRQSVSALPPLVHGPQELHSPIDEARATREVR